MRHDPPTKMELTRDELLVIAGRVGLATQAKAIVAGAHSTGLLMSELRQLLTPELWRMTCHGLTLCSRAERRGEFPCPVPGHVMQD